MTALRGYLSIDRRGLELHAVQSCIVFFASQYCLILFPPGRFTVVLLIAWPMKLGVDSVNMQIAEDSNALLDSLPIVNMCLDLQLSLKSHLAIVDLALISRRLELHSSNNNINPPKPPISNSNSGKGVKPFSSAPASAAASGAANASARAGETRLIEYDGLNNSLKVSSIAYR